MWMKQCQNDSSLQIKASKWLLTGNLLLQGWGLRVFVPTLMPSLSAPALRKPAGGEFGHCHPIQQHGFGLFPQLSIRKTLGEGRAEGLQRASRTCSLLSFSTYRSAPFPECRWHRCNPASNFLGGIKKKKKNQNTS